MRTLLCTALLALTGATFAADIKLKDWNWTLTDITSKGLNREKLFEDMDTDFILPQKSICSNRALMWAQDFKSKYGLNTAKLWLFYTDKKSKVGNKTWWYHVTPAVNENGKIWAMDPGFPDFVDGPLTILDWAETMTTSRRCKEIRVSEKDLVEKMFDEQIFPKSTKYGHYDCYVMLTPHTLWTPESVAMSVLQKDSDGKPIKFSRPKIDSDEYFQSCREATTGKWGFFVDDNKAKCRQLSQRLDF